MIAWLRLLLSCDPAAVPFVESFFRTGEVADLLVMCDVIEEGDDVTFHPLAAAIRTSLTTNGVAL